MNKISEAIDYSTQLQSQYLSSPEFLFWRGKLWIINGNLDMGKKFIREALSQDPDNTHYQKQWRNLAKMEKLKQEANDLFKDQKY